MSTYSQVLAFSIIVPLIFSFHNKIQFQKQWAAFFKANILVAIPFLIWDELFTRNEVWGFTNEHLIGAYLFNLPIEEILFFIIIPYCCTFTYEVFLKLKLKTRNITHSLTLGLGIIILLMGGLFYNKIYTAVTFISLGVLLVILSVQKKEFINTFYLTYLVITASFFLLVNGILTGGTLENPPVWYNNSETLNIRIWTIPIEDFFYSMLLLLSNIWLFETFKSNAAEQQNS
jgi:lycopene cyclase domain-containing protein